MNNYLQSTQKRLGKWYLPIIVSLFTIIMVSFGYFRVQNNTTQTVQRNQVAQDTVLAPYTIEDEERTEALRNQAVASVENSFTYQRSVLEQEQDRLNSFINWLSVIRDESYSTASISEEAATLSDSDVDLDLSVLSDERDENQSVSFSRLSTQEQQLVLQLNTYLLEENNVEFVTQFEIDNILSLLVMSDVDYRNFVSLLNEQHFAIMAQPIYSGQMDSVIDDIVAQYNDDDSEMLFADILSRFIQPTMLYDEAATLEKQTEAYNSVQPAYILQGQVIVQEGHIVDGEDIRQLNLFNYFEQSNISLRVVMYYLLVFIHAIGLILIGKFYNFEQTKINITAYLLMFIFMFSITMGIGSIQSLSLEYLLLLLPISTFITFLLPLLGTRWTLGALTVYSLFQAFPMTYYSEGTVGYLLVLYFIFVSLFAIGEYSKNESIISSDNYKSGLRLLGTSILLGVTVFSIFNVNLPMTQWLRVVFYIVISYILTWLINTIIYPYWESLFSNKAKLTLNELSNLNHPLLQELIERAPGTYNHSMMVANLSSNAVDAIGGDGLLTRVAGYYHDVGKMSQPLFFTENVSSKIVTPHKALSPEESAKVIIDHVHQGVEILRKHKFPQSIIDICYEHHGTTLVKFFHYQATQEAEGKEVDESKFRYDCRKPQSKEAAIIMIADSCEAASRSLKDYEPETITDLVNNIINTKLEDNQFSDCGLTVHELKLVKQSLIKGIGSMYHTRIDYPS
ncbi:HDIG domain-containing protein [Aerococcaceae bacterium DSM 111022]|nr:HDIG domain-containing protein [Aerococcaceae bacterium DSM 111022]